MTFKTNDLANDQNYLAVLWLKPNDATENPYLKYTDWPFKCDFEILYTANTLYGVSSPSKGMRPFFIVAAKKSTQLQSVLETGFVG